MYLDIELSKREMNILDHGGFISLVIKDGVRIIVKKKRS